MTGEATGPTIWQHDTWIQSSVPVDVDFIISHMAAVLQTTFSNAFFNENYSILTRISIQICFQWSNWQ